MTGAVHEIRDDADLGITTLNQRAMVWRSINVRPSRVFFKLPHSVLFDLQPSAHVVVGLYFHRSRLIFTAVPSTRYSIRFEFRAPIGG